MSDAMLAAQADKAVEFSFPFNHYTWTFVIWFTAKICGRPRVEVFEDGVRVGTGYLRLEEGPMFDGAEHTPLGGKSLFTEDGDDIEMDDNGPTSASELWGEMLGLVWAIVRPEYERTLTARTQAQQESAENYQGH